MLLGAGGRARVQPDAASSYRVTRAGRAYGGVVSEDVMPEIEHAGHFVRLYACGAREHVASQCRCPGPNKRVIGETAMSDNWKDRAQGMVCATCVFYVPKEPRGGGLATIVAPAGTEPERSAAAGVTLRR